MKLVKLLAAFLIFSVSSQAQSLPDVTVKTLNGESVRILDYAENDKLTVVSFWATWCTPCKKELDAIADLYPDWVAEYDVEMVAITIDDARQLAKVKPMVSQKGWEYTILSDTNKDLMRGLNFQTIPQTYLLDKKGNIVYTHSGYAPGDEYELEDHIAELAN
jgi:peroxiredoxin